MSLKDFPFLKEIIGGLVKIERELKAVYYIAITNIPLLWTQGCKGAQFLSGKAWEYLEPRSGTSIPGCMLVFWKWLHVTIARTWSTHDRVKKMRNKPKIVKLKQNILFHLVINVGCGSQ